MTKGALWVWFRWPVARGGPRWPAVARGGRWWPVVACGGSGWLGVAVDGLWFPYKSLLLLYCILIRVYRLS